MRAEVGSVSTNYELAGEGETLVLLLHGWGASLELYRPTIELLKGSYRVAAPDFPGFGGSAEPPDAWDVGHYADWTVEFIKMLGAKRVILVGHSFGGRVTIKLLSRGDLPFAVERAVLIDSAGIKPTPSSGSKLKSRLYKIGRSVMGAPPMKKLFPNAVENMRKRVGSADYNAASPLMRQVLVKTVNEDLTPLLEKISVPTLLIWGEKDTATPLSDGQTMERLIPNAGLVTLRGAGHYSFIDDRFTYERVMKSFLKIG